MKSLCHKLFSWNRCIAIVLVHFICFANNSFAQNCASTNLGEAAPFALFTFGNFRSTVTNQTWGRVAVGGNFTVDDWTIGGNNCLTNDATRYDLVVGGNLRYNAGIVSNGSVAYGNNLQASPSLGTGGAVITNSSSIVNFTTAETNLKAKSTYWSSLSTNGTINNNGAGTITFTGTNNSCNIFNITASSLQAFSNLTVVLNVPTNSTVLINVSGNLTNIPQTTVFYNGSQINTTTAQTNYQTCPQSRILWNISNSSFTMTNVDFQGSILAPWATINSREGEINGQLICNKLEQANNNKSTIKVNCTLFQGCLPEQSCNTNAGANQTICAGNTVTLTGTNPTSGIWSSLPTNATGFSLGNTNGGIATISFNDTISTKNFYFIYSSNSCTDTTMITINALPVISSIQGDSIIIVDDSVTFSNTNAGGVWTSNNTAAATLSSSNGKGKGKGQGNSTILYSITNANGCNRTVQKNIRVVPKIRS